MAPLLSLLFIFFHLVLNLNSSQVSGGNLLFEDGYTVSTVFNGNKVKVNPHSILPQSPSSNQYIVLDSASSTFYTVSIPTTPQEIAIKRLAGNGKHGYADGDLDSAMFNKPKSFAVDYRGNVYVADQKNLAIRKITKSGVTTIAGGYSQTPGRADGPARNASFSVNFELVFVPQKCALMVSDIGNKLIRQINLKAEDCTAHSGSGLGVSSAWLLGVGLSCLFGLIVGFIIRPYVIPHEGSKLRHCSGTLSQCLMSLERQIVILCSDLRSVVVSSTACALCMRLPGLSLSTLSLIFRIRTVESPSSCKKPVSLMDCDVLVNHQLDKVQTVIAEPSTDFISFDGGLSLSENSNEIIEQVGKKENAEISSGKCRKIDGMIQENIASFTEEYSGASLGVSSECSLGLLKRRLNAGNSFY